MAPLLVIYSLLTLREREREREGGGGKGGGGPIRTTTALIQVVDGRNRATTAPLSFLPLFKGRGKGPNSGWWGPHVSHYRSDKVATGLAKWWWPTLGHH
ncbi:hypothetical protein CRG98_021399 [Punica granatum]|uniref:Uncharacterized protein n=1 Tax=Punica granatum TaxID=22663 RepID=A0A2I0JPJ8_PUNGR|nr:hypothetical protein CRG98_021399 [Punica granatum]